MKYCTKCGAEIPEGTNVCPSCGFSAQESTQSDQDNSNQNQAPNQSFQQQDVTYSMPVETQNKQSIKLLVLGIVSLSLCAIGWEPYWGFIFSVASFVIALIAIKQANIYMKSFQTISGKAKVGRILAKIALPLSIVMFVVFLITTIVTCSLSSLAYYN